MVGIFWVNPRVSAVSLVRSERIFRILIVINELPEVCEDDRSSV